MQASRISATRGYAHMLDIHLQNTRGEAMSRDLNRDSPDEPRTGVNFCAFPAFWQDRRVARTTALTSGSSNGD
jgi:hypothetical protein